MLGDILREQIFPVVLKLVSFSFNEPLNNQFFERLSENIKLSFFVFDPIYIAKKLVDETSI